jgi:hypothetical protein
MGRRPWQMWANVSMMGLKMERPVLSPFEGKQKFNQLMKTISLSFQQPKTPECHL